MPDKVSAAGTIPQYTDTFLVDNTRPAKLVVEYAADGVFRWRHDNSDRAALVLLLGNVEPDCTLEYMNISAKPDADWESDAKPLPANLKRSLPDGRYALILGRADADKLGLKPGHIFEIRQKDPAENEGEPTRIILSQKGAGTTVPASFDNRARDQVGASLPKGDYYFYAASDTAAPVVLTKNMRIDAKDENTAVIAGNKAVEPGCTIAVANERTRKEFRATADATGTFRLEFAARAGDPLHLRAYDHNNVMTDLGMTPYAPTFVKAGPLAQKELQDAAKS